MASILQIIVTFCLSYFAKAQLFDLPDKYAPKRCCTPNQFEADLVPTTLLRARSAHLMDRNIRLRMSYDYKNKRWALDQENPKDITHNLRLVHDYNQGYFYAIGIDNTTTSFCQRAQIPTPVEFSKYCIRQNATFHGFFQYGGGKNSMPIEVWSHDMLGFPIRSLTKVTQKQCIPVQESGFGLVANTWKWFEGEKPCNPWKFPRRAETGDCWKSHVRLTRTKHASQTTVPFFSYQFRNFSKGIKNTALYDVPEECEDVKAWDHRVRLAELHNIMRYKLKSY